MSLRKEVKEYINSCEHLLSDSLSTAVPFSPTERGSIDYYATEVTKLISSDRYRDQSIIII